MANENRLAELERKRQALVDKYKVDAGTEFVPNPTYKKDVFDANSYLSVIPKNPDEAHPLPTGRAITPSIPSDVNAVRMANVGEFALNPEEYFAEHTDLANNEQSLLDQGKSMMSKIFDYRDESDLSLFGMNISGVESVWDGFLRHLIGGYDLLNIGMGALVSAAPGGLRTLEFSELSGGKGVGEVLSGEMEPGDAPSVGQIAIASIAVEAKRIREGGARPSDVLLANAATAPFILAALAAESSPLQQDGFDIMDKEQRDKAFGSGFEQWFSGITDAGLMFADPLIGVGYGAKVARVGLLGTHKGPRGTAMTVAATSDAVDGLDLVHAPAGFSSLEQIDAMATRGQALAEGTLQPGIAKLDDTVPTLELPKIDSAKPRPEKNPIARFLYDLHAVDESGARKITLTEIAKRVEFKLTDKTLPIASLLYDSTSYAESALILNILAGDGKSLARLKSMAPALADEVYRLKRAQMWEMSVGDPDKVRKIAETLGADKAELLVLIEQKEKVLAGLRPTPIAQVGEEGVATAGFAASGPEFLALSNDINSLRKSLEQADEMQRYFVDGVAPDVLDPTSAFYNRDTAYAVIDDLIKRSDFYKKVIDTDVLGETRLAEAGFITKTNVVARTVSESRKRRAAAASQYAAEKTAIFPRAGQSGWFAPSQFEGVSRFKRNMRVWRWMGTEKPVGLIGLHGTATVGADRELLAAMDLQIYRGKDPVTVTISRWDDKGEYMRDPVTNQIMTETVQIGGQARRQELIAMFARSLDDPKADNFQVLKEIEVEIARDLARMHNLDVKSMDKIMEVANNKRLANLDLLREKAMFVDPVSKEVHMVPLGPEQLANSTYMQNFQAMETLLAKKVREPGGIDNIRKGMEGAGKYGQDAYKLFNDVWRPATLLRISYMNRNILDGMVRSMAYQGSLAPMLWPTKAAFFGVRNKIVASTVGREVARSEKIVNSSEFGRVFQEFTTADARLGQLQSAQKGEPIVRKGKGKDAEEVSTETVDVWVPAPEGGGVHIKTNMTVDEWQAQLQEAADAAAAVKGRLQANLDEYNATVDGTKFGDWRQANIEDLRQRIEENKHFVDTVYDAMNDGDVNGAIFSLDEANSRRMQQIIAADAVDKIKLNDLLYNPVAGQRMYKEVAGRARRIGSGTSIGPGGTYYDDAFAGPYEQLNRALLSSDNTYKMQMSLRGDVWSSLFTKNLMHNRDYVEWNPKAPKNEAQWVSAQASVLERASSNAFVRYMVIHGWDEEKGVAWLTGTGDGRTFYDQVSKMFAEEGATLKPGEKQTRIKPFGSERKLATGETVVKFDMDQTRLFVRETIMRYRAQLQNVEGFERLLEYRVRSKVSGSGVGTEAISGADVKSIIDGLSPEAKAQLGAVQGSELIDAGTDGARNAWTKFVSKAFAALGTIPEDALVRGPFYNARFKEARNELISMYWEGRGITPPTGRRAFGASGREQFGTVGHGEFEIPPAEWGEILARSHRRALATTREYMYTIERQTNLGKYGEWIFPFITAQQNTLTVAGKLLNKNPWLAPMISDIWRMPNRLGIEDEEGNLSLPMPAEWVTDFLKDNPNIPVIGGVLDSFDSLKMPKNGMNVWLPDSGFGVLPRPSAWVQVGASELMKWGLFPVEAPSAFKALFRESDDPDNPHADADEAYQQIKNYIFGENSGMSGDPVSFDKLLPAWVQKGYYSRKELSTQYGYKFAIHYHTQMMRWMQNDRPDMPTSAEINKRVTNAFWFDLFGSQGVPTPLTPFPIVTRPVVNSPVEFAQKIQQMYSQVDPAKAAENMSTQLGEWMLGYANTKVTRNVGGGDPVPETITDIKKFDTLIRSASSSVPESNLDVIGLIINNRTSSVDYEKSAYEWQTSAAIPGSNRLFREVQSPDQSILERQRIMGWTKYRMAMDKYDARLLSMGLSSYEVKAASELKAAKDQFTRSMMLDPELKGWAIDYQDIGGARSGSAIRVMELAVNDETFVNEMAKEDKTNAVLNIMRDYTDKRRQLVGLLKNSGHNIDHEDNALLKQAWAEMRQVWKNSNVRWAEIADLYLSSDDNPTNPGSVIPELMQSPVASMSGESNG